MKGCVLQAKKKRTQRGKSLKQNATACSWFLPQYVMCVLYRDGAGQELGAQVEVRSRRC